MLSNIHRIEKKYVETKGEVFICDLLQDSSYHLTLYIVYNFFVIGCNFIKITDRSTYLRNMSVFDGKGELSNNMASYTSDQKFIVIVAFYSPGGLGFVEEQYR
jgi:hypothetical protein